MPCRPWLSADPQCTVTQGKREHTKLKLELLEEQCAAQVRARAQWVEKGEKNTQFFLNLEKSRANAKIMDSIKDVSGQSITGQMNSMSAQRNYFADLYKKKVGGVNMAERIDNFMNNTSVPMLSENHRKRCEGALLEAEVLSVLKQMKTGYAPGIDSITKDLI